MATLVYLVPWTAGLEGWTDSFGNPGPTWISDDGSYFDGSTTPGCIEVVSSGAAAVLVTLGAMGFPVGATVLTINVRARAKNLSGGPRSSTLVIEKWTPPIWPPHTGAPGEGFGYIDNNIPNDGDWHTIGGQGPNAPVEVWDSTTSVKLIASFVGATMRFDSFEVTLTYTEPEPTIAARSASVPVGHTALIDSGVPIGPPGMKARSAGVIAHAALVDHCDSAIEVYLAGAESGDLLSSTAYSAPTVFTLPSTASSGHNYILQLPATDLAKFASGRLGFVKFRYAGGTKRDCAGDLVLGGIEIIYNEKTVT